MRFSGAILTEPRLQNAVRMHLSGAATLGPPAQILSIGVCEDVHARFGADVTVLEHAPPAI